MLAFVSKFILSFLLLMTLGFFVPAVLFNGWPLGAWWIPFWLPVYLFILTLVFHSWK